MPPNQKLSANIIDVFNRWVLAGMPKTADDASKAALQTASNASTPTAEPEGPAHPSNPGGTGDAINLKSDAAAGSQVFTAQCQKCHGPNGSQGVDNPGSADGSVPPLNPIDSTLVSTDYKTFASNLDLFVQHGSTPEGPSPKLLMPAYGDQTLLTQQQLADVIAYVISLNPPAGGTATPSSSTAPGDAVNLTGDAAAGGQVFKTECEKCHGPNGAQGVDNPGSTDGSVPVLNPIDPEIKNADHKTFATNLDAFVQHGSTPDGPSPKLVMPAYGDQALLTQQQLADVIAYIIKLNP
jgi:mono/diheme cytochrome c family protein